MEVFLEYLACVLVALVFPFAALWFVLTRPPCRDRVIAQDVAMVFAAICSATVSYICVVAVRPRAVGGLCSGQTSEACFFLAPIAVPIIIGTAASVCVLAATLLPPGVLAASRRPRGMAATLGIALAVGAALALVMPIGATAAVIGVLDG